MAKYDEMSIEELEAENEVLMTRKGEAEQEIKAEQMKVQGALDKATARARFTELTAVEREALIDLVEEDKRNG